MKSPRYLLKLNL